LNSAEDIWYMTQTVSASGAVRGHIWGYTNSSSETVRLIVSEYEGAAPIGVVYDSGWLQTFNKWQKIGDCSTFTEFSIILSFGFHGFCSNVT